MGEENDLVLAAITDAPPASVVQRLNPGIVAAGGWVLSQDIVSSQCAEIHFEFTRECMVEMYSLLVALGVELTAEAQERVTGLCCCTHHLAPEGREAVIRLLLSLYTREGSEAFLREKRRPLMAAA